MPQTDPSQPADLGAVIRFTQGTDQVVDQTADEIARIWDEKLVNGDPTVIRATLLGHPVFINPRLMTVVLPA